MDVTGNANGHCEACGSVLAPEDRFCEECGAQIGDAPLELPHVPEGRVELDLTVAAGVTDQGRVHRRNEDAFHLERIGDVVVAVVCDGISTAASGDAAARGAAAAAGTALADAVRRGGDLQQATIDAVAAAQEAVRELPFTVRSDVPVPSCTLVSAVCSDGEIFIGWLGDSRAYWIAAGDTRQLTVDDSWASEQVAAGLLSAEEAARDRRAHAITRWVGSDAPEGGPQIVVEAVRDAGRLVLCSDGVWNYAASPSALAALVQRLPAESSAAAVARTLADAALERGGHDNITAVVIGMGAPQEANR
jgi:serine/threonine protein phosphatase PrpC